MLLHSYRCPLLLPAVGDDSDLGLLSRTRQRGRRLSLTLCAPLTISLNFSLASREEFQMRISCRASYQLFIKGEITAD
jgi:hypothetical protein